MKIIITENKLTNSIYNYIDETFNPNDMDWVYGLGVDDDGYVDIDKENENFLIFFNGEWEGEEDSDSVFHYLKNHLRFHPPCLQQFKLKELNLFMSISFAFLLVYFQIFLLIEQNQI